MSTAAQIAANQANAKLSTGPNTEEGKAISSRNNFRHGCAGKFMLLPQESIREFQELKDALTEEHQPATPTEVLLVERMVQHFWLSQRAMRLQNFCFDDGLHQPDLQKLSLYLRYQSTHDRAFHKCLTELQKLRAEQRKAQGSPVSNKDDQRSRFTQPVASEPPASTQEAVTVENSSVVKQLWAGSQPSMASSERHLNCPSTQHAPVEQHPLRRAPAA